jgi:hypothetical protein
LRGSDGISPEANPDDHPDAMPTPAAARIAFTPTGLSYVADRQGMILGVIAGGGVRSGK